MELGKSIKLSVLNNLSDRIAVDDYKKDLSANLLKRIYEVLDCSHCKVKFVGETIELRNEDDSSQNKDYTDFNEFINFLISTLEEAMKDPENDYLADIEFLKTQLVS
jgi:hypothetical protein